ncbi:MAG: hypothetical protein AB1348_07895 [Nitrospirota bacterium]
MILGILVINENYKDEIVGLSKAAVNKGHKVNIFMMDKGCLLLKDPNFTSLKDIDGVSISLCDLNRRQLKIRDEDIPDGIICGSQYNNAQMVHESDKVIVF